MGIVKKFRIKSFKNKNPIIELENISLAYGNRLILDNINFESSFKLSILTLTNTTASDLYGLSDVNFSNLLTSSKIFLIIFMTIAKIELISVFLIIKQMFFRN